jgi:hypothetical protein
MGQLFIEEAMKKMEKKNESDVSVLEKLLQIDRKVAVVMALDMILAGVDTVKSIIHHKINRRIKYDTFRLLRP